MFSILLKKALPFTLTFVLGAALSGLAALFGTTEKKAEALHGRHGRDYGRRGCRMRSHKLIAESKPLVILDVPDASWPREVDGMWRQDFTPVRVRVMFGADGKVQKVKPSDDVFIGKMDVPRIRVWDAAASAARNIQFEPETINSVPVSVEREVEIRFIGD